MEFNGRLIKSMDWVLELSRLRWRNSTDGGIQRVEIFRSAACQRFEVELFHDSDEFSAGGGVFEVLFRQWFEVYVFHDSGFPRLEVFCGAIFTAVRGGSVPRLGWSYSTGRGFPRFALL